MLPYQILSSAVHENYKKSHKNNKFKISPSWSDTFKLPDGSYSVSDIQKIIKNHDALTDNPPTRVCVNKVGNRIRSKI